MEIWKGLGKLCEGSEDLRKQKIEILLKKFKSFKMLPGESFDMLDERFHKIPNDLASLNHVLSPKEKNVRLLRSLPTEWYTKATAMEEGRNLENYTVQGLLDELRTYEHELKKKKEEQVTPFSTALMTTPRVPSSEGTCPRNCDTPSSNQPSSSRMENYDEEFAMMVKQFQKFKKFFKKADSVRRPSKGKPQVSDSPPESYLCYNCRKPGHWKSACPYPKVEKYGERERNEKKKKKAMVAAESDESSSSISDEEALVCMEHRAEKSNHEDRWTMSGDDTHCLMAKDDVEQEVTSQTSCSSSYESIPTSEILFDKSKKMMKDFEEINLKHSSLTEEKKLLSEENLKLTESRKSQLSEITQLKAENESLSKKVKSLNKELGILKSKEGVDKLLETTKHKDREGLGFDPSSSKRKGKTTFIPPKPTAKPNKQKGKEKEKPTDVPKKEATKYPGVWYLDSGCSRHMTGDASLLSNLIPYDGPRVTFGGSNDFGLTKGLGNLVYKGLTIQAVSYVEGLNYNLLSISQFCDKGYSLEFCKDMASLKNNSTNEVILTGKRIRNIYEVMWDDVKEACLISKGDTNLLWLWHKRFKYEEEVMEFYRNGEIKTVKSKENPERSIQLIKSTVGGMKVKISQKRMQKKLHLPNSGIEIGKLSSRNLDWKTIGNSGQIPSGPAKKADLKNDYKLVLDKQKWPKQKYLCQGLCLGYILESMGVASKGKKYDAIYWLHYMSSKGENRTGVSATAEESSSNNVPIMSLKKSVKRKQVVSPSPSAEAPHILAALNLEEEEEVSAQGELQRKKKRKITSPSTSGNINPDELVGKEPVEEHSAHNQSLQQLDEEIPQVQSSPTPSLQAQTNDAESQFMQLYYDWRAWKVENSVEKLLEWDQKLKNEKIIKRCLGLPVNYCCEQILDVDWVWQRNYEDLHLEYLASTPVSEFEVDDEDPSVYRPIFSKATEDQMALTTEAQEATTEDFQVFPETSPAFETNLPEAVQENGASPQQEQNQEASEEELLQLLQSQVQEIITTPCEISNQRELEIPEKSTENLEKSTPPETNAYEAQEVQVVEIQRSSAEAEKEAQMAGLETFETPVTIFEQKIGDEDRDSLSRDISKFMNETEEESEKTLMIDDEEAEHGDAESLPLQLFHRVPSSHQSNPENSIQHLSNTEFDGTEAVGTIVSHFTNDAQTEEIYNNLKRIEEECGVIQGIGEIAGSSKRKKNLSQRSSKLFTSNKKGSTKDWKPFFVFVSMGPESPFTGSGLPSFRRIPCPPSNATLLSMTHQLCSRGAINIKEVVTEESLAKMGFEFVQDELCHQPELLRDVPGGGQPDQPRGTPEGVLDCVELQDLGEEMDNDLLLRHFTAGRKKKREARGHGKCSSSHRGDSPSQEPAVIVVEDQDDAALETGTNAVPSPLHSLMPGGDLAGSSQGVVLERPHSSPAVTYKVATEGRSTRLSLPPPPQSLGDVQLETLITLPAEDQAHISAGSEDDLDNMVLLRLSQATLGMIEVVDRKRGRQAALDEAMKAAETKQKELQEEVARLMRELEEKESCCAVHEAEKASQQDCYVALEEGKASLSLELELERSDRARHVEDAIESFKSSPGFTLVALERMDRLAAEWLKTKPGAQWMIKEGTKSFNCGLFRSQQVFRDRLAQLPKGFSLPDLGFPPPYRSLAEFDPSPYLDGGSSSASDEEEEEEDGQGDQNPGASLATSKAGENPSSSI
ncbi:unnamed protein product [Cuscuta campestris]|uniref:CCHC-type domain-containing protein n=1 Tax=Cuscuta campestris TaxID=132261 RepID=A0A484MB81_9ASTE|nr:unnamed protein product [Cuscuta campestris]